MKALTLKILSGVILGSLLAACSGGGGGGSSSANKLATDGEDISGTYRLTGIKCFLSDRITETNAATYSAGYSSTLVISGNSVTETVSSSGCQVTTTGNTVFNLPAVATFSNTKVSSATGSSCNIVRSLSNGAIAPNNENITFSTNQTIADKSNLFWLTDRTSILWLQSHYSDGNGGNCVFEYAKQ